MSELQQEEIKPVIQEVVSAVTEEKQSKQTKILNKQVWLSSLTQFFATMAGIWAMIEVGAFGSSTVVKVNNALAVVDKVSLMGRDVDKIKLAIAAINQALHLPPISY